MADGDDKGKDGFNTGDDVAAAVKRVLDKSTRAKTLLESMVAAGVVPGPLVIPDLTAIALVGLQLTQAAVKLGGLPPGPTSGGPP